jgi:CRP/FNR family cyclic AMP-dependent transcriptional regulator
MKLEKQDLATLSNTLLFSGLTPDALERLVQFAPERRYKARTLIMEKGDEANTLYVILEGRVRIFSPGDENKEITLNELSVGEYFGELALITDKPRCASAITTTPVRLLAISKSQFNEFLASEPDAAPRMIQYLAEKVREVTQDVERLALEDVYGRLVDVLQGRAEDEGGQRITPPLTQQELANLVGASREMINRILKDLKAGDYIAQDGKRLIINRDLPSRW